MSTPNLAWLKSGSSFKKQEKRPHEQVSQIDEPIEWDMSDKKEKQNLNILIESSESYNFMEIQMIFSENEILISERNEIKEKEEKQKSIIHKYSMKKTNTKEEADKLLDNNIGFEDKMGNRDMLIVDKMCSDDMCLYKKSKIILGFEDLPFYIQKQIKDHKKHKSYRYFTDPQMNDLSSITRSFAYDQTRLTNREHGIGLDYIATNSQVLSESLLEEYGDCVSIPFIPLPSISNEYTTINRLEIHEQLIKQYMANVDANPTSVHAWMKYIELYEVFANEAETRKEKLSMYQMECDLLDDALKKIPKDERLINAKFNILMKLKTGTELNQDLFQLMIDNIDNGYKMCLGLFQDILMKMNTYYYSLVRSGASEIAIADYQRQELAVIYMFSCMERVRGSFYRGLSLLRLLYEFNVNSPSLTKAKSLQYKRKLFQAYFTAQTQSLIGNQHYISWKDWTENTLIKLGKLREHTEDRSGYSVSENLDIQYELINSEATNQILVTPFQPLTPWPCHIPTKKEIEQVQTEAIGSQLTETNELLNNQDIEMVYSKVHGYRIPVPVKSSEQDYYAKILNEINDINNDEQKEIKKKKVKVQHIEEDDLFLNWLHGEDFDDIMQSGDDEDHSEHDFVYSDIEDFFINLTPALHQDLFLLILDYVGVSLKVKWFPLFRRVREITIVDDEGWFAIMKPKAGVLSELSEIPPISVSLDVLNDERRQLMVRNLFRWYIKHEISPNSTILLGHTFYESLLAKNSLNERLINTSLLIAKYYMQMPANRNDLRYYLNYIDINMHYNHFEEAKRICLGTLALFDRLSTFSQRWKASVIKRWLDIRIRESSEIYKVKIDEREEEIMMVKESIINEIIIKLCDVLNDKKRDEEQLKRKLIYLLKVESDYLKNTEYQEADDPYCVYYDLSYLYMYLLYWKQGTQGIISACDLCFQLLQPSDSQVYPVNYLVEKMHACRLYLLYYHSLILLAVNQNTNDKVQLIIDSTYYFTSAIRNCLIVPKKILRNEIIKALRDCPDNVVFMALLCKHNNESLFAGPLQEYFNAYIKGMENSWILPENKPSELMGLLFIYVNTIILIQKHRYITNTTEKESTYLPDPHYIRSLYDRLLRIPYLSSSIVLWRSYLYYEYHCGNYNNAKHVFYSAINKCPYSKVLWTDAIRVLRPIMKDEEIINVIAYCQSKDIIINSPLNQE